MKKKENEISAWVVGLSIAGIAAALGIGYFGGVDRREAIPLGPMAVEPEKADTSSPPTMAVPGAPPACAFVVNYRRIGGEAVVALADVEAAFRQRGAC